MFEKEKKRYQNHCATALLLLLLTGITYTQNVTEANIDYNQQGKNIAYDETHNSDTPLYSPDDIDETEHEDQSNPQADTETEFDDQNNAEKQNSPIAHKPRRINAITVSGNNATSADAILSYVPYKTGELFDSRKTRLLIHNLYYNLKKFRTVKVMGELVGNDLINLHVVVEEKLPLKELKTIGNKHVSEKEIAKKIGLENIKAIDPEELKIISNKIKEIYLEKGYNQTDITTALTIDDDNNATAVFTVDEGPVATVKQIKFIGNKHISGKELRAIALTKEDWLLSFLDKSGNYHPDRLEADKHFLEQHYQNYGFLHAKVVNIIVDINQTTQNIVLTFEIEEGDRYTIESISAPGNDLVPESYLLAMLPIRPNTYYSREGIANSIKRLELIWGDYGYIFAHIEPSIQPNEDNKTVAISFFSDLGDQVYLNRINIRGNKKTRDKIIRRKILLEEGDLLTQNRMNLSKRNVASLGYFDPREGVNWKIRRINKQEADLDLIVKETKTGHLGAQLGFGGAGADLGSPLSGVSLKGEMADTNLFGSGVYLNLSTTYSKDEQTAMLHLAQPWMFDKPILGAFDIYHRRPVYDEFRHVQTIHQKLTGGSLTAGFITQSRHALIHDVNVLLSAGVEDVKYQQPPQALFENILERAQFQSILDKEFAPGTYAFVTGKLEQDTRNHPVHTMYGHKWRIASKFAIPTFDNNIGFYKLEGEASWFTPLIAEYDLILKLHGYFGISAPFKNRTVPFGELFHIGGQNSVRGFLFGQIGPKFLGDTIGGTRAFFWNAELIVPITSDMNMKAVVFYDGGAGFNNPYLEDVFRTNITGNGFDYRHAVGIGVRLLQPMPINIDWGFKLDPRKNKQFPDRSESASEIHFGMSYDW